MSLSGYGALVWRQCLWENAQWMERQALRGVPTDRRKPCGCRYRCIERVCRSVGTIILCDFCYFRCKMKTEMDFDQDLTSLIFPFRWACFPIKIGRNAQWEHLFSMYFDDFLTMYLMF